MSATSVGPSRESEFEPKRPEMSLGELLREMTAEVSDLFRKELQLAKVEARDEVKQVGAAAGMFGVAVIGAWLAVLFASLALAWLLDQALNTALAFLIVGVLWAVMAAVMSSVARRKVRLVEPLPETRETLKEDMEWARAQTS